MTTGYAIFEKKLYAYCHTMLSQDYMKRLFVPYKNSRASYRYYDECIIGLGTLEANNISVFHNENASYD